MTPSPLIRILIGQGPPWNVKYDLAAPVVAHFKTLIRHWMWRSGAAFGGITTFATMQLGPLATGVYVAGIFIGIEAAMKLDKWVPHPKQGTLLWRIGRAAYVLIHYLRRNPLE